MLSISPVLLLLVLFGYNYSLTSGPLFFQWKMYLISFRPLYKCYCIVEQFTHLLSCLPLSFLTIVSLFTIHVFTLLIPFHLSHVECKFHGTKQCFVQIYFYFHTYVQLQMHSYTCIYDRSWWEYIRKNLKISVCVFEIL